MVLPLAREVIIIAAGVPELATSRHRVQVLSVVLTDLIVASELLRAGPGLGVLVAGREQESRTPRQQHVPDAVGVVIVVTGHHGGIDGNGHSSH